MDTVKIKNRLAEMLVFEDKENLDLSSPSLHRMVGKVRHLISLKKNLYKSANYIFDNLRNKGNIVSFADHKSEYTNPQITFTFSKKGVSKVGIQNKLMYVSNKKSFQLNDPIVNPASLNLDRLIMSEWGWRITSKKPWWYKRPEAISNASIVFSKPKIFFDYFSGDFKIKFDLLKVTLFEKTEDDDLPPHIPLASWAKAADRNSVYAVEKKTVPLPELDPPKEGEERKESGFDDIRGVAVEDIEVQFITKQPETFMEGAWCRRIDSMTEEFSKPRCGEEKKIEKITPVDYEVDQEKSKQLEKSSGYL